LDFAERLLKLEQHMPELLKLLLNEDKPGERQPTFKVTVQVG
jgi:hypothetical protein